MNDLAESVTREAWNLQRILGDRGFFGALLDALPIPIMARSATEDSRGRFLIWNRAAEETLGFSAAEVLGKTEDELFRPEQVALSAANDRRAVESRKPLEIAEECYESKHQGRRVLRTTRHPIFDAGGNPLAVVVLYKDVTDRRSPEREIADTLSTLQSERSLFFSLLARLPIGVFARSVRPGDFGRNLLWNPAMEEVTGVSATKAIGALYGEYLDPDGAAFVEAEDRAVIESGEVFSAEREIARLGDGSRRVLRVVKVPLRDADGKAEVLLGLAEDLTDVVTADEERSRLLYRLEAITTELPCAVYEMRAAPDGELEMLYISAGIEAIMGVRPEQILAGISAGLERIHPDDFPRVIGQIEQSRIALSHLECELRVKHTDGTTRWLLTRSKPHREAEGSVIWHGFVADITEQKLAQEAIRTSEERWGLALSSSDAAVWDWTPRESRAFYSERWAALFGWSPAELPATARGLLDLVHPGDRAQLRSQMLKHLRGRSDEFECEYRMRRSDGNYRWVRAQGRAILDERRRRPTRMVGTIIDISARKEMERMLLDAKNAAETANQAKGDFLAMMSHEIRTPLNGLLGFAELLADSPLNAKQEDYVQTIRESGATLLTILNDILDYSKIESGQLDLQRQPIQVRKAVESVVDFFAPQAQRKGLAWQTRFAKDVPGIVVTDPVRLRQMLMNLLSNALKFTSAGSVRCEVMASRMPDRENACILHLIVADTGMGIAEADQKELFKPFRQIDTFHERKVGGAGLGLSIVKRLAELLGGSVELESIVGQGSTFCIHLPCETVGHEAKKRSGPILIEEGRHLAAECPMQILIVEDNEINRRLIRLILQRWGYAPDEVGDGSDAVVQVLRKSYDLILMDIQMPGLDGYEAARQIRSLLPPNNIFIAALTAHAIRDGQGSPEDFGLDAYLTKPLKVKELYALIHRAFQSKQPNAVP